MWCPLSSECIMFLDPTSWKDLDVVHTMHDTGCERLDGLNMATCDLQANHAMNLLCQSTHLLDDLKFPGRDVGDANILVDVHPPAQLSVEHFNSSLPTGSRSRQQSEIHMPDPLP